MDKAEIINLLEKHDAAALKSLGQHFLTSEKALNAIVEAANIKASDIVLEIGPGIGVLTQELVKSACRVVVVEKDRKMVEILEETLGSFKNMEIVCGDILKIAPHFFEQTAALKGIEEYKIVANLPYYITSPIIRYFLENAQIKPKEMILMVQKEVAQRICSKPPDMSLLAVSVQFFAEPEIVSYAPKSAFWPQPKIDSAIIKIKTKREQPKIESSLFFKIAKTGFLQPRKQLINNFSNGLKIPRGKTKEWLLENKIQPEQRAETLSVEDWISLASSFKQPLE